jgi:predicted RNA binding protein YcfA (HicA-like mRNA interferase family)
MGRLRVLSGREACQILQQHGIVMQRPDPTIGTVTVPVPDHPELAIGTLLAIIRQSRVPRAAFETSQ